MSPREDDIKMPRLRPRRYIQILSSRNFVWERPGPRRKHVNRGAPLNYADAETAWPLKKASRSVFMMSAWVAGMPCGRP